MKLPRQSGSSVWSENGAWSTSNFSGADHLLGKQRCCDPAGAHEMSRLTPGKKSVSKGTVEWAKYRLTEEATVVLHRPDLNTGLGVTIAKYPHDVPHPRIFELSKDGIAARSGLLKVKDVIVAVNSVSVNSDAAAAQELQLTGSLQITFTIRRTPSPLSAHQVHTPVQNGKARLNAAPDASTEGTAEPWSEPEQPAYPLQLALASPPQSPAPIAFDRRAPPSALVMPPDRPYSPSGSDVPSPTSTPSVKGGLPRRAPPGLPSAIAFGAHDGEKEPASPKSDGTETSAEGEAEAGLDGKHGGPVASAKEIDFWGACHPLTASSAHTATRFASIQRLLPFHRLAGHYDQGDQQAVRRLRAFPLRCSSKEGRFGTQPI